MEVRICPMPRHTNTSRRPRENHTTYLRPATPLPPPPLRQKHSNHSVSTRNIHDYTDVWLYSLEQRTPATTVEGQRQDLSAFGYAPAAPARSKVGCRERSPGVGPSSMGSARSGCRRSVFGIEGARSGLLWSSQAWATTRSPSLTWSHTQPEGGRGRNTANDTSTAVHGSRGYGALHLTTSIDVGVSQSHLA